MQCATHPNVETELTCGRCGTPICPRCLVMTPVGARCRDCAQLRRIPTYEIKPTFLVRGVAAAAATGAATLNAPSDCAAALTAAGELKWGHGRQQNWPDLGGLKASCQELQTVARRAAAAFDNATPACVLDRREGAGIGTAAGRRGPARLS